MALSRNLFCKKQEEIEKSIHHCNIVSDNHFLNCNHLCLSRHLIKKNVCFFLPFQPQKRE